MNNHAPAQPPRVALIGVTGFAKTHLNQLLPAFDKGLINLAAAVVINPEQAVESCEQLKSRGTTLYGSHEEMLQARKGALDLCVIPTGIHWHAPMSLAALQAGASVLVEKPLCGSDEEAADMIQAGRESGRFLAVGFQDLYDPKVLEVKKILLSGKLGKIRRIRGWALWPRGADYYGRNAWAGRLQAGGRPVFDSPFNNAMAHFLNLLLFFAGDSMEEMAVITGLQAELFRTRPIESFDTGSLLARTSGGTELTFHGSHSCRRNIHPRIWIEGEKGTLLWGHDSPSRLSLGGVETELFPPSPSAEKLRSMLDCVLRRLSDPGQWICSAEMAATHTRLINRLHREFPIRDLPSGCFSIDPAAQLPVLNGIEERIAHASEKGLMLGAGLLP